MSILPVAVIAALVAKSMADFKPIAARARAWRPMIREISRKYGLSEHILIGLIYRESSFNPNAVSSAGARGLTQFLPIAAKDVGIDFEDLVSDPRLQIEAACRLLRLNYDRLDGDTLGSLRAFYVGIGAAKADPSAGSEYAINILKTAALDWLHSQFDFGEKA